MDKEFGSIRIYHQIPYNGMIITYLISGDSRDFFVNRLEENYAIDEDIFPKCFEIYRVKNEIQCTINNPELKSEISSKIQMYLDEKGLMWNSH